MTVNQDDLADLTQDVGAAWKKTTGLKKATSNVTKRHEVQKKGLRFALRWARLVDKV